jgi:hypothetical protein
LGGLLVNYLKLDSISIVGWSDGGCWVEMAISGKSKIETCSNGLRPDSTAVNSWAVKEVLQSKKMINSKFKKKTLQVDLQNNFSDFWVISQFPIEDLSK